MGKNRKSGNSSGGGGNHNILGHDLSNIQHIQENLANMSDEEMLELGRTLKNEITYYAKYGGPQKYYKFADGNIVPQHHDVPSATLEDYTGETYQNEYYRQIRELLSDVRFEYDVRDLDYKLEGPDGLEFSWVPVVIYGKE